MSKSTNPIQINLAVYADQLRGEISSDLTALKILDDAVENNTYSSSSYTLQQGMLKSDVPVPPLEFLKQREINKCFKAIIGSLQDYMDKLIAVFKFNEEKIIPPVGSSAKDIELLIQTKLASHLLDVSTDHSLNIPRKLEILLGTPENNDVKDSVQSYFNVRNGLEHHKGIAKADRVMTYKRMVLESTSGQEIIPLTPLGGGEGIVLTVKDEDISYDKGGNLLITRQQLDGIVLYLQIQVIPTMQQEAGKIINTNKPS